VTQSSATLIDEDAWARMTREAGMRLAPVAGARRYLCEVLTGCALVTAPGPYRLGAGSLGSYSDFVLGMPASLTTALAGHARRLLAGWGIDHERLHWQPPEVHDRGRVFAAAWIWSELTGGRYDESPAWAAHPEFDAPATPMGSARFFGNWLRRQSHTRRDWLRSWGARYLQERDCPGALR
jgi:hypothetical protein